MKPRAVRSVTLSLIAAILVAATGRTVGRSVVAFVEQHYFGTTKVEQPIESQLAGAAAQTRAQLENSPTDEHLRLTEVATGPGQQLTLRFSVQGFSQISDYQAALLFENDKDRVCGGAARDLLDRGVPVTYRFADDHGAWTKDVVVGREDCDKWLFEDPRSNGGKEPVARVALHEILKDYRANKFAAAAKYENGEKTVDCLDNFRSGHCRFVEIRAMVKEMGRTDGKPYVDLISEASEDQVMPVRAWIDGAERKALEGVRRGQRLSVRCIVDYPESEDLYLSDCLFAS